MIWLDNSEMPFWHGFLGKEQKHFHQVRLTFCAGNGALKSRNIMEGVNNTRNEIVP